MFSVYISPDNHSYFLLEPSYGLRGILRIWLLLVRHYFLIERVLLDSCSEIFDVYKATLKKIRYVPQVALILHPTPSCIL